MMTYELMLEMARERREEILKARRWAGLRRRPRTTARELEELTIAQLSKRVMGG